MSKLADEINDLALGIKSRPGSYAREYPNWSDREIADKLSAIAEETIDKLAVLHGSLDPDVYVSDDRHDLREALRALRSACAIACEVERKLDEKRFPPKEGE